MKKIVLTVAIFLLSTETVFASDIPGIQTPIPITPSGSGSCPTGYYIYQQPLKANTPTLDDVFTGKAHFQLPTESETIKFSPTGFLVNNPYGAGQKMPILYNPADGKYYTFTRQHDAVNGIAKVFYNIAIYSSSDGINFNQVGWMFPSQMVYDLLVRDAARLNFLVSDALGIYDAHLSIDYSVCPTKYIMAMECSNGYLCASYSTNPTEPLSWSAPVTVIDYDSADKKSASTGVFLIDGSQKYASWTVVDDKNLDTYSRGIATQDPLSNLGLSTIGNVLMPAEKYPCASAWDCNNRDKQDWKKEGNYYYLMYNGGNYYRCGGDWGIGIVRSTNPLSGYSLPGTGKILDSENKSSCGIGYPVINNVGGALYMYYDYQLKDNTSRTLRSKLVWNPDSAPNPADLNTDGRVDIYDYNIIVRDFGQPYTIFDYNQVVGNFGK